MRFESDAATPTPILPQFPCGSPLQRLTPSGAFSESSSGARTSCVHESPPSRETYRPLPAPPLVITHGFRCICHKPAKRMRGLFGSKQTSLAPVSSSLSLCSTCCHVLPPSFVR